MLLLGAAIDTVYKRNTFLNTQHAVHAVCVHARGTRNVHTRQSARVSQGKEQNITGSTKPVPQQNTETTTVFCSPPSTNQVCNVTVSKERLRMLGRCRVVGTSARFPSRKLNQRNTTPLHFSGRYAVNKLKHTRNTITRYVHGQLSCSRRRRRVRAAHAHPAHYHD